MAAQMRARDWAGVRGPIPARPGRCGPGRRRQRREVQGDAGAVAHRCAPWAVSPVMSGRYPLLKEDPAINISRKAVKASRCISGATAVLRGENYGAERDEQI